MSIYTEKQTQQLIDAYLKNPCLETVSRLSVDFNRPKKSIISKLVKEGVYQTTGYRDKRGEVPITKLAIVRKMEVLLGLNLMGLDKTPKSTLQKLHKVLDKMSSELENATLENEDLKSLNMTLTDTLKKYRNN